MLEAWVFSLNALLAVTGLILAARYNLNRQRIWSVTLIPWTFFLIYLVVTPLLLEAPQIVETDFNLVLTTGLVGCFIGQGVVQRGEPRFPHGEGSIRLRAHWVTLLATLYGLYLTVEPLTIASQYGLKALFFRDRVTDYLSEGITRGNSGLGLLAIPLSVFFYLWVGRQVELNRWRWALAGAGALSLNAAMVANTRFPIIMPLAALGACWWKKSGRRISLVTWLLIFAAFFASFLVFNWASSALRHGTLTTETRVTLRDNASLDSQYYNFLFDLYSANVPTEGGRQYWLSPLVALVPRLLWPDKPITSTANLLSEIVYGIRVGDGTPITTFTIFGEGYWQLGYFGAAFAPIIFIIFYVMIIRRFERLQGGLFCGGMVLLQATTFVRSEVPLVLLIVWWATYRLALLIRHRPPRLAMPKADLLGSLSPAHRYP